jgi:hypothetical protein
MSRLGYKIRNIMSDLEDDRAKYATSVDQFGHNPKNARVADEMQQLRKSIIGRQNEVRSLIIIEGTRNN